MWKNAIGNILRDTIKISTKTNNRLNWSHHLLYAAWGKRHYMTEFNNGLPHKVLDVGCGTGIWMRDVADQWAARYGHAKLRLCIH